MTRTEYKALFLDVDGTVVPYEYEALPSDYLCQMIRKAQEHVTVCLVTGRSYGFVKPVLKKLNISSGFVVVNTGAAIIDLRDESVVHTQPMNVTDVAEIVQVLRDEDIQFSVKDTPFDTSHGLVLDDYTHPKIPETTFMVLTGELFPEEKIDLVLSRISHLTEITPYKTTHKDPKKFGINITHLNATKLQGVEFLIKKLQISRNEVIGVGDSYNDFPLLMASGLKVAMGNATDDLKAVADFVAPRVTEDGVAEVIKKYIL